MSAHRFVQVAVNIPVRHVFDYAVPPAWKDSVACGKRVLVPFGCRLVCGYIVALSETTNVPGIKEIKEVIDPEPIFSGRMLEFTRWIAEYYFCSWGEALEAAVPGPFKRGKSAPLRGAGKDVLETLAVSGGFSPETLTGHQLGALAKIESCIRQNRFGVFLLHGITASGKTEIYLRALAQTLSRNKSAIVFVPEIALTPQTLERFMQRFGKENLAVVHSRLSRGEKFIQWQKIKTGRAKIVIGARSAIFSPVDNLGLIVVDEEHEHTYKQEDIPRYHLVTAAAKRAEAEQAVVILGSATPSLESFYEAKRGRISLLELPERIEGRALPPVQIVDMRLHHKSMKRQPVISRVLEDNIGRCLKNKEQAILLLNRRGFSTFINCTKCGYVLNCKRCDAAMVHHFDRRQIMCHHCRSRAALPQVCPQCGGDYMRYSGMGTQKVESELHRLFPAAVIGRMDSDILKSRQEHFDVFERFKNGKIDMLVGTQMLAKGLDFPNVTLVGVISADVSLSLPDFRAAERTFSLLTQVAGRAGRGDAPGKVIIQTYTPENYAITCALNHDYRQFYKQEMRFRRQLDLPPYTHLVMVLLRSKKEGSAEKSAREFYERLKAQNEDSGVMNITEPALLPVARVRGYTRWAVIIKSKDVPYAGKVLEKTFSGWKPAANVRISVDVDPMMLM